MCASLPTLRLFFKSVAPGFMSSSNGAGSKTTSGRLGVYGSRSRNTRRGLTALGSATDTSSNRNRQDYANFDDDNDYRLETMVVGGPRAKDLERGERRHQHDETDPNNMSREWSEDGLSDKGIVQTKTTAVTYSGV